MIGLCLSQLMCQSTLCLFVLASLVTLVALVSCLGLVGVVLGCLDLVFSGLELGLVVLGGSLRRTSAVLFLFSKLLL